MCAIVANQFTLFKTDYDHFKTQSDSKFSKKIRIAQNFFFFAFQYMKN